VTRGYLNQPEMTSQRFVPDRFLPGTNARLYRTGDVARFLPDGRVEYLGRADGQVKIRGYRVELAEIESLLSEHPAVGQAAVGVHAPAEADSSLIAYVVPARANAEVDFALLREHLRSRLPDYMVPSDFVRLSRMPLTPNGKLDRNALPAPEREAAAEYAAPDTPTERALAELWQLMLRVERIGAKDNFFESGGHSLLAMRLVGRVRERFGVELPLKHVFERPTLAGLAQAIDALAWMEKSKAPPQGAAEREETVL
jgi:acyl carrier protein